MGKVFKGAEMVNIVINASHTSYSPGAVWGERNEHSDVLKFARFLSFELERDPDINCIYHTGDCKSGYNDKDVVLILHRDSNCKNCNSYGCSITVQKNASADIQYEAYRLLGSLGGDRGFRIKGVHTNTDKTPFKRMENTGTKHTFLIKLGFIDSWTDNKIFDTDFEFLAEKLAAELKEIFKGDTNEAYTAV